MRHFVECRIRGKVSPIEPVIDGVHFIDCLSPVETHPRSFHHSERRKVWSVGACTHKIETGLLESESYHRARGFSRETLRPVIGMKTVEELKLRRVVEETKSAEADEFGLLAKPRSPESATVSFKPGNAVVDFGGGLLAGDDLIIEEESPHAWVGPQRVNRIEIIEAERLQAESGCFDDECHCGYGLYGRPSVAAPR